MLKFLVWFVVLLASQHSLLLFPNLYILVLSFFVCCHRFACGSCPFLVYGWPPPQRTGYPFKSQNGELEVSGHMMSPSSEESLQAQKEAKLSVAVNLGTEAVEML